MAPKRKAESEAGEGPSGSAAKQPKKSGKAKEEKSADAVERINKIAMDWSKENEPKSDPQGRSKSDMFAIWREVIAQHLVREPEFLERMKNPPTVQDVTVAMKWLASIRLERRWVLFNSQRNFKSDFWDRSKDPNSRLAIIQRAFEIYDDAIGIQQSVIDKTKIPPPPNDDEAQQLRETTFFYQIYRNRMIDTIKLATDQEYTLIKRLMTSENGGSEQGLNASGGVVEELDALMDMKEELRGMLNACLTEDTGKSILDDLLNDVAAHSTPLFALPQQSSMQHGAGAQVADIELTNEQKIGLIDAKYPFTLSFFDDSVSGKPDVVTVATPRDNKAKDMNMSEPVIKKLNDQDDFAALDNTVSDALVAKATEIDRIRFKVNLQYFEGIVDRPEKLKNATPKDVFNIDNAYGGLLIVHDNLYHVRSLVATLKSNNLLDKSTTDANLQQCLRRMWAVVAVMYGCEPEGSLWLTVMDSLLEDLARMVRGQVDPRGDTARMERFRKWRKSGQDPQKAEVLSTNEIHSLERDDLARRIFSEIARFFRGAVLYSYLSVNAKTSRTLKPEAHEELYKNWYKNLAAWNHMCGHPTCVENIKIVDVPADQADDMAEDGLSDEEQEVDSQFEDTDDDDMEIDDPGDNQGGQRKAGTTERHKTGSRSQFGISVSVRDARVGLRTEREEISTNRDQAYACPYVIILYEKWHQGFGPFFHYFSHFWHSSCIASRGKTFFIQTVNAVDRRIKDPQ